MVGSNSGAAVAFLLLVANHLTNLGKQLLVFFRPHCHVSQFVHVFVVVEAVILLDQMGRIFIMINVGFIVVSSTTVEIKLLIVVLALADVGSAADINVVVVTVVVVVEVLVVVIVVEVVVEVVVVVVAVVEVLVVVVVVDLEERFPHVVLQGQHLPVRMLTHLFFLRWYLHSLQHFSAGPPMMLLVSIIEQQNPFSSLLQTSFCMSATSFWYSSDPMGKSSSLVTSSWKYSQLSCGMHSLSLLHSLSVTLSSGGGLKSML